jgi:dihydroflavonol-4-reductase
MNGILTLHGYMDLITGATGLLGSRLLLDLRRKGRKCRVLLREKSKLDLIHTAFNADPDLLKDIDWFYGDILDVISLEEAMIDIDHVYHCAATVSFNPNAKDYMMQVNALGTANVLNAALNAGIKKFCFVSSVAAIGRDDEHLLITEKTPWTRTGKNSNYAISKQAAEAEAWRAIAEGLDVVIVNPGIILGQGDWDKDSSRIFGETFKGLLFYSLGKTGFIDVRDVSEVMIKLMESEIKNQRFILVSENLPFRDLLNFISDEFKIKRPAIAAGKFLASIAWRFEKVRSMITGNSPLITMETARSANGHWEYDNAKIKKAIDVNFIPISESVKYTCQQYLSAKNN